MKYFVGLCFWFSTFAAAGAGVVWIRSFWRLELFVVAGNKDAAYTISLSHGALGMSKVISRDTTRYPIHLGRKTLIAFNGDRACPLPLFRYVYYWNHGANAPDWTLVRRSNVLGFGAQVGRLGSKSSLWAQCDEIFVPIWLLVALFASPLVIRVRRKLERHHRLRAGRCATCGYDLRGSKDRCPECGSPILVRQRSTADPSGDNLPRRQL
jgi:DNA-directed RNA polymerase subunit RPC12/RpoP